MVLPQQPFRADGCTTGTIQGSGPVVSLIDWDHAVVRSDPKGLLVRFDAGGDRPIRRILVDLEGDGEPGMLLSFDPPSDGSRFIDGRYMRATAYKPTVNGTWRLSVTIWDDAGCSAKTTQAATVIVVQ